MRNRSLEKEWSYSWEKERWGRYCFNPKLNPRKQRAEEDDNDGWIHWKDTQSEPDMLSREIIFPALNSRRAQPLPMFCITG